MKQAKIWYAIADGGQARFVVRDAGGAFRTVVSFDSTKAQAATRDIGADRPGRVHDRVGPGRHAVESRQDFKQGAKEDFVKLVADELAAELECGAFDELILVAPAGVLTELKQKLAKPVVGCVVQDLQKDLTNVPDGDLTEHLAPR